MNDVSFLKLYELKVLLRIRGGKPVSPTERAALASLTGMGLIEWCTFRKDHSHLKHLRRSTILYSRWRATATGLRVIELAKASGYEVRPGRSFEAMYRNAVRV